MHRRQFLGLAGLLAFPYHLFAKKLHKTPDDTEGPFYPVVAIPMRSQLIKDSTIPKQQLMLLKGKVINSQGKAIEGAKIEIWQCDSKGLYDHPYQANRANFDTQFAGFGARLSDVNGQYAFTTLYPVPYTGRPPHIHVKIWLDNKELLTTQLYLQGKTGEFWSGAKRDQLQIDPKVQQNQQYQTEYTFVV